jgi:CyaY protein
MLPLSHANPVKNRRAFTLLTVCFCLEDDFIMSSHVLSDAQYHSLATGTLARIEAQVDEWLDAGLIDIDTHRTGGLLELTFPNASKIIINLQPPLHELWMAAKAGGFHFHWVDGQWRDTRGGEEFFACLSQQAARQAGTPLAFLP